MSQQSYFHGSTFSPADDGARLTRQLDLVRRGEETLWRRVIVGEPDECWEWQGHRIKTGYGRLRFQGRRVLAHRLADFIARHTEIPEGIEIIHTCDNPPCVNPRHLQRATHKENMEDRDRKLRGAKGESNGRAKLTEHEVREIIRLRQDDVRVAEIAARFGISQRHVYALSNGAWWKHLTGRQVIQ